MNELLQSSGKAICSLPETWLPKLGGDWWKECVIQRLTFQLDHVETVLIEGKSYRDQAHAEA